ncbi:uncharacterized protein IUM83_03641 [Phytophthora cinnamomi]|uniref:uncharacterized protein n=1 Tax=Phytophthora cinnamomi TaxID=4785 RepID=UPI00355A6AB3|nr:hypothetical protein IUM83_03641 [Phytophthora cinnamomi]
MQIPAIVGSESASGDSSASDSASNSAEGDDNNDVFVYKVPFITGNITGTMVITIDKSSLSYNSKSTDPSKVYDFGQLEKQTKSGSEGEGRGRFGFVATHFVQDKLTEKAMNW